MYQPIVFPGVIYKMGDKFQNGGNERLKGIEMVVFSGGNLVITGAKSAEDLDLVYKLLFKVLLKFRVERKEKEKEGRTPAYEKMDVDE